MMTFGQVANRYQELNMQNGSLIVQDHLFLEENTRRRGMTEYVAPKWPQVEEVVPKHNWVWAPKEGEAA